MDNGVRTFIVSADDLISLQPILAGDYVEMIFPNTSVFPVNQTFYLGFYSGEAHDQNGIYAQPLFGWGEFLNNGGVIELLSGALEYGGGGIYAGTQNIIPVPEPGTLALTGVGALLIASDWWRKRTS